MSATLGILLFCVDDIYIASLYIARLGDLGHTPDQRKMMSKIDILPVLLPAKFEGPASHR